ncbi:hypothetical protein BD414DRAFT_156025 [Trametes punicea]|nr:hypothetical protein BD414DRAFT_156025 [Trametes punicea]
MPLLTSLSSLPTLRAVAISLSVSYHFSLCASAAFAATSVPNLHVARQDLTSSTSSFDWWPYPPWGASETSFIPSSTLGSTPILDPPGTIAAVTSTVLADDTSTATTSPPPTFSTTSRTVIHITALPPANSSVSVTRTRNPGNNGSHGGFDIVYLAPVFALLGAIAGILFTWLLYRYVLTRAGHRRREQSLEPGPQYTPPSRFRQAPVLTPAPLEEENLARPSQSSAHPLLRETAQTEGNRGSWLTRAFSSRDGSTSNPIRQGKIEAAEEAPAEDDPFLDRPTTSASAAASAALRRQWTSRTTFSQRLTSPDPYGALSDEEDSAPYETLRHKSIRRGILERLRLGSLRRAPTNAEYEQGQTEEEHPADGDRNLVARRPTGTRRGHKRDSSDMTVNVNAMRSPMRTRSIEDSPSRRPTLSRNPSELVRSPPGFRLVVEDPESGDLSTAPPSRAASPSKSPTKEGASWGWNIPWPSSPTKQRKGDDKFTTLPVRRSLADIRGSPHSSPSSSRIASPAPGAKKVTETPSGAASTPLARIDSSILPASPPRVTSPPLESQLFFGAVPPDFGSNPSLNLRLPDSVEAKHKPGLPITGAQRTTATPGDKHKKLRTHRSPPLLPFPSTASSSPFRGRLKKSPTKRGSPASQQPPERPHADRAESADSAESANMVGRGTPAQRYEARRSALNKVEEILSRSWSERQLAGEAFPGSPTNFGAFLASPVGPSLEKLIEDEALNGMGIEQRLEALRSID